MQALAGWLRRHWAGLLLGSLIPAGLLPLGALVPRRLESATSR